jgi:gliding motility-associated-like protein
MLKRTIYIYLFLIITKLGTAQCPSIYDYLGNLVTNPYFINCQGSGTYNMNVASNSNWGAYIIDWGDGTSNDVGTTYTANSLINHIYNSATPDTFVITISIPSQGCVLSGIAVMEKPVNASIQIPIGGVTTACAPKTLLFTNSSTDVSETTIFTWNFGDGSPVQTFNFSNVGQTVSHNYLPGTVNCETTVTLTADNYCTNIPSIANFNPIQIYNKDDAVIIPSAFIKCWPDNIFNFNNTTNRNCVPQGNTFQRQEKWNLGNYWGFGYDSIINWQPWPPSTPLTVAYPSAGTYTIQLLDSNLCGVDIQVQSVTIFNPPTAGLLAPTGQLCEGTAVTFTNTSVTGYSYKWNFGTGGGFVSKPYGNQTFTYNTAGTFTISVIALIGGGGAACTDTDKVVITILPRPTANFAISQSKGCNTIIGANFTDLSVNAVAWNWDFGNTITFNGQFPPSQNYNTVGSFVASLTITAVNTCTNYTTLPVVVYQIPVAAFTPSSSCVGTNQLFNDASTHAIGDPILSWNWDFGDASPTATATAQNPTHTYTAQNTYTVQLIASTNECTDTVIQNFVVNIKPTADFNFNPTTGCPTVSVNFNNTSSNAISYNWVFGNGNISILTNPTETFTNTTSATIIYTINLTAIASTGCSDTHTSTITVFEKPTASFNINSTTGCSPIDLTFSNNSIGATNYNWDFGDLTSSTSSSSTILHSYTNTTLLPQTFTPQLVATSINGCIDSTSLTVTIYPTPVFNFTMLPSSGCSPLSINFPPVVDVVTYEWDFGDGSPTEYTSNPSHTFTNTTAINKTYTVQLIATSINGCKDTIFGYPEVFSKPIADFIVTQTVACSPLNTVMMNTSLFANSYLWKYGDGNTSITFNTNYTYTNASNITNQLYNTTLLAINANGCADSITKALLVLFNPKANFTVDTPSCSSKLLTFTNTSQGASSYNWDLGLSTSTNTNVTQAFTNTTTANITNTVQLIVSSINNCTDTIAVPIIVHPEPEFIIVATPDSGCSALTVNFPDINKVATYQWNFGDGNISNNNNPSNIFYNNSVSTKTFTVELIGTDNYGCRDTSVKTIKVFAKPIALFQANPTLVYVPTNAVNCTNLSTGAINYFWNFGDGNTSTETSPSYVYQNAGEYQIYLIAKNVEGCLDTFNLPTKIVAELESTIDIPNAFSPNLNGSNGGVFGNNDINNDVFHPVIKDVDEYELTIFSRWGELLFVSNDITIGWDGYYKGKLCTQDVYVWKINATTLEGKKINKTGDLLLLR